MKHCPVSGLPITEKEHWSFEHRKGNYIRKYGLIGTDILHVQEIADHAITPEQLYTEDFTSLIAEENLTDNPLYLLMDCAPISGVSRSYKKEFTTLLLDAESPFRLIVLYNIDPAVRLQFELLQALEGTQRPVMLAESYNSATTAILEFKIGTTDAGKAEPQSKSLEEPALKQEFLTETATMLLRNHFDRNLFLPPEDHSAYPFFLILDLIRQDMKALEEEHRQTVERIEQEFRMLLASKNSLLDAQTEMNKKQKNALRRKRPTGCRELPRRSLKLPESPRQMPKKTLHCALCATCFKTLISTRQSKSRFQATANPCSKTAARPTCLTRN